MKRTASWGWAIAPIPTPNIIDETKFHQNGLPVVGKVVQPVAPVTFALSGKSGAILLNNSCAWVTPPSIE